MNLLVLIDYRGTFYSSTRKRGGSMDVEKLKNLFISRGYKVLIKKFSDLDFRNENYQNWFVLYQSSEDPDLKYKDYIEDVLLGLEMQGAKLIPDFFKFRAHHNKVFMEIIRDISQDKNIKAIDSEYYGVLESLANKSTRVYPQIIKPGSGSKSKGVSLVNSFTILKRKLRFISQSKAWLFNFKHFIKNVVDGMGYRKMSNYRNKFIIQNFIPDLNGDYKILFYSEKCYVLRRKNRPNDFRASGSGNLEFPENPPKELLDYAYAVFKKFNVPFASFDVAFNDDFYLLEFQFVSFGQYALEKSPHYFRKTADEWRKINGYSDLEEEFANSVHAFIAE